MGMETAMTTSEPSPPAESPPPSPALVRATRVRAFQILLGLGFFCAIAGAALSVTLVMGLNEWLRGLSQWPREVAMAVLTRLWVLALVPLAAWVLGRTTKVAPARGAAIIAGWGEVVYLAMDLTVGGWPSVYRSGVWFGGRVATLGIGILLGAVAARRGRARARRAQERVEAEAAAVRARYQAWLTSQPPPGEGPRPPQGGGGTA